MSYIVASGQNLGEVRLSRALDRYINEYMYMRDLSPHTIHSNKSAIGSFIDLMGDKMVGRIKLHHIVTWKLKLEASGVGCATIYKYISVMKRLLSYTGKHTTLSLDVDDIQAPRARKKLPVYLSLEDARKIVEAASLLEDQLLIYLLFSTGMRISEAVTILISNIEDDQILINGKGNKDRYVFLDDTSRLLIRKQKQEVQGSKWLFPSPVGANRHITDKAVRVRLKDIAREAGVTCRVAPHMFRHTFGIELMRNGCHIRYIQELLGHSSIVSTQIYTQVTNQSLRDAYVSYGAKL